MVAAQNIIGLSMGAQSARATVERIQYHLETADHHLESARQLILDLKDSDGWKALGYKSWSACIAGEFGQHRTTIHRQLKAAMIELELMPAGQQLGDIPERVLRPLAARNYDAEARRGIWAIANEAVQDGGKVTSGVVNVVIETIKEILVSEATDGEDGMHPLTERVHAQIVAAVREKKLAHKEHIKRMGKARDYVLGGVPVEKITRGQLEQGKFAAIIPLDEFTREKLVAVLKAGKTIYASLWTED